MSMYCNAMSQTICAIVTTACPGYRYFSSARHPMTLTPRRR